MKLNFRGLKIKKKLFIYYLKIRISIHFNQISINLWMNKQLKFMVILYKCVLPKY